ncbi:MAG: AAA family ATPase [Candidatus Nezhaarchaeota archaeon]|nr:AAA family ATPase [Candidatus Nezhaarchaeota archaeon]
MSSSMREIEDRRPWWLLRPKLRALLSLPLYLSNREYRRWRNARLTPKKLKKRLHELNKKFSKTKDDLIGRDKEFQTIMTAIAYHVIEDPAVRELFKGAPPPKFFILKGSTGSGKSLLAEVCLREAVVYGLKLGVNVQPIVVNSDEIFHPLYGQSIRNLATIFKRAEDTPSVIFFDEFHSIGMKVDKPMYGADREDVRVQDAFIEYLNRIINTNERVVIIAATNKFESIREDIRRRAYVIDLDQNITRDMLLAVLKAELKKYGWTYLDPEEVMDVLEKSVSSYRQTQLTPFDIIDACNKVRMRKVEPLREKLFRMLGAPRGERFSYKVTMDDFKLVARELRGYVEQEKSTEVLSSVLKIKPAVSYEDVGGLFGIKEKVFKIISLSLKSELASKLNWVPPKGFLLWGEPGCGKTYLSKAIAKECDATFFYVPAAQLLMNAKWVGEPEKNIKDLFQLARRNAPSIIFFDEFDVIAGKRRGDPVSDRLTAQILTELDGLQPLENVIVIAATNRLDAIDEAVLNRFEPYIIEIPLPRNDAERLDVIRVHLRQYVAHLHEEVTPEGVLSIIKRFRVVSPRVIAEVIREANRLRSQEVVAASEYAKAMRFGDKMRLAEVYQIYREDLERIRELMGSIDVDLLSRITPESYKIRLYHFEKAAELLEPEIDKELMDAQESMVVQGPGVALGLATDPQGRRGMLLIVECAISRGTGKVTVTGAARSVAISPMTTVEDVSVIESAQNAVDYVKLYVNKKLGIDVSDYDFRFQVVSPLEGVPGGGVSGPSLGVALSVAAISELSGISVSPTVVMTGKTDIKGRVGPVGGLGWRGAGKIIAAIKTRRVKVRKFIMPKWNYENSRDEVRVLEEAGISVIPVEWQLEAWLHALDVSEEELLRRIATNIVSKQ